MSVVFFHALLLTFPSLFFPSRLPLLLCSFLASFPPSLLPSRLTSFYLTILSLHQSNSKSSTPLCVFSVVHSFIHGISSSTIYYKTTTTILSSRGYVSILF
ncbi:hypothetical protein K457DRAFT_290533 [Linnemannia elongata AG-77]|uniref:REJ domain-containing protein n=1 Tax=Linnemannia elongata AG-77 TaxID=1314771 RepID=A0A197K681_9FUNG|nr:hypothetical protein K457DRAFT_290533 [Linnemannia elongata AG-77]